MELILETHRWPSSTWSAIWAALYTTTAAPAGGAHLRPGQALTHVKKQHQNSMSILETYYHFSVNLLSNCLLRLCLLNLTRLVLLYYLNLWLMKRVTIKCIFKKVLLTCNNDLSNASCMSCGLMGWTDTRLWPAGGGKDLWASALPRVKQQRHLLIAQHTASKHGRSSIIYSPQKYVWICTLRSSWSNTTPEQIQIMFSDNKKNRIHVWQTYDD